MNNKLVLEVCVDSVESAVHASEGGATRLELCGNLVIGGTTPSPVLFESIRRRTDIPVNVLIRPRFGDFLYSEEEFEVICGEVAAFRGTGANGVVVGCLKRDGSLDRDRMERIRELAGDMEMTLHRAFDACREPMEVLRQCADIGISTILTSGQQKSALEGKPLLKELVAAAGNRTDILVGGGVSAPVIRELISDTGAKSFHMSGKITVESGMVYRNRHISMGDGSFSEYEIMRTDEGQIREARQVMEELLCLQRNA